MGQVHYRGHQWVDAFQCLYRTASSFVIYSRQSASPPGSNAGDTQEMAANFSYVAIAYRLHNSKKIIDSKIVDYMYNPTLQNVDSMQITICSMTLKGSIYR